jgi:hypothetical protein
MTEPILFITTSQIHDGALDDFKEAVQKTIGFLEANGPQLFGEVCINEAEMRAYTIQLHRDSESILTHWGLADPYQRDVMQYITTSSVDIYGQPNEVVMDGMRRLASQGAVISITPRFSGFVRLPSSE